MENKNNYLMEDENSFFNSSQEPNFELLNKELEDFQSIIMWNNPYPRIIDETVLIYHDIALKKSDIDILSGPFWINDQIIAFYFQYLESHVYRKYAHDILLVSPQVTQLLKMIEGRYEDARNLLEPLNPYRKNYIFFPVNNNDRDKDGGTHWNLLVYSRPENTFYTFDSNNNNNDYATQKLVQVLRIALNCVSAHYVYAESMQQENLYDCGIYVICNVENIMNHIVCNEGCGRIQDVSNLDGEIVSGKRNGILRIIKFLIENS